MCVASEANSPQFWLALFVECIDFFVRTTFQLLLLKTFDKNHTAVHRVKEERGTLCDRAVNELVVHIFSVPSFTSSGCQCATL